MESATDRRLAVYVDPDKCIECYACEVACKQEHGLPIGPRLIRVVRVERLGSGRVERISAPIACAHCSEAACIQACPSRALSRWVGTGAVLVNRGRCIGCRMCLIACPFGAPQFEDEGKMVKCDLCPDRLVRNEKPACVSACPSGALKFELGDRALATVDGKRISLAWAVKEASHK
jgi:Fe-S-cluster-containing dehydrogenase component